MLRTRARADTHVPECFTASDIALVGQAAIRNHLHTPKDPGKVLNDGGERSTRSCPDGRFPLGPSADASAAE